MKKTIFLLLSLILMGQGAFSLTVNSTAGGLATAVGAELSTVTNLTVMGVIDARDFVSMYNMPLLAVIDLSGTSISAYTGEGPSGNYSYLANFIPTTAFRVGKSGKTSLTSIILPNSTTVIGNLAFQDCTNLASVTIPVGVTTILNSAFYNCQSLSSITLPSTVITIEYDVFGGCNNLSAINIPSSVTTLEGAPFVNCSAYISVDPNNQFFSSNEGVLFNKNKTTLFHCPNTKTGSYIIPSTVTCIYGSAFGSCTKLSSISIPSSVYSYVDRSIMGSAFANCTGLTSIYAYSINPVQFQSYDFGVFTGINKATCTLYVPVGSKAAYQGEDQWKDFTNIVEGLPSAVNNTTASLVKVYASQSAIIVEGTSPGETVTVYNMSGVTLQTVKSQGERLILPVKSNGVYLVKTRQTRYVIN